MQSIFVSIANYRDPEVANTVATLLHNTSPDVQLRIVVLSQCPPEERIPLQMSHDGGRIMVRQRFVDPLHSKGACWARSEIQREYAGEDYYLQLDSHVELVRGWDRLLLADYGIVSATGLAILTTYLQAYRFAGGARVTPDPPSPTHFKLSMKDGMISASCVLGYPHARPVRAPFFSGHFTFAPGRFVIDVPYDPDLFFWGEEITMAVRAYSSGYELYTPSQHVGVHLWDRLAREGEQRKLFWNDAFEEEREIRWTQREQTSRKKIAAICAGELDGLYGVRDVARYIKFRDMLIDRHGVDLRDIRRPPPPPSDSPLIQR